MESRWNSAIENQYTRATTAICMAIFTVGRVYSAWTTRDLEPFPYVLYETHTHTLLYSHT